MQTGASGKIEKGALPPKPTTPSSGLIAWLLSTARYRSQTFGCYTILVARPLWTHYGASLVGRKKSQSKIPQN